MFGRLLYISTQKSAGSYLTFCRVSAALAHIDGSLSKNDKSQLRNEVRRISQSTGPLYNEVDVTLMNIIFHLHILRDISKTYG